MGTYLAWLDNDNQRYTDAIEQHIGNLGLCKTMLEGNISEKNELLVRHEVALSCYELGVLVADETRSKGVSTDSFNSAVDICKIINPGREQVLINESSDSNARAMYFFTQAKYAYEGKKALPKFENKWQENDTSPYHRLSAIHLRIAKIYETIRSVQDSSDEEKNNQEKMQALNTALRYAQNANKSSPNLEDTKTECVTKLESLGVMVAREKKASSRLKMTGKTESQSHGKRKINQAENSSGKQKRKALPKTAREMGKPMELGKEGTGLDQKKGHEYSICSIDGDCLSDRNGARFFAKGQKKIMNTDKTPTHALNFMKGKKFSDYIDSLYDGLPEKSNPQP